jgi:hypothetical protein
MRGLERERAFLVRQTIEGRLSQREASERLGIGCANLSVWCILGGPRVMRVLCPASAAGRRTVAWRMICGPGSAVYCERNTPILAPRWRRRSFANWIISKSRPRRCAGCRSILACGDRRSAVRNACSGAPAPSAVRRIGPDRRQSPRLVRSRGPRCTLIVFIDDATSRLTALHFAPVASGKAYLAALREQILVHGGPLAFYSDRHGIFRVNAKDAQSGDGKTELAGWWTVWVSR